MANFEDHRNFASYGQADSALDQGLRNYMLKVFNLMAASLAVSGVIAYMAAVSGVYIGLLQQAPILFYAVLFAPLGILFYLMFRAQTLQYQTLQGLFWTFVFLEGFSLGSVFLMYTGESLARVFLITAITFSACSIYGYRTKQNLAPLATFFLIALIGLLVAMVVNFFLQSTAFQFGISVLGVLIMAGITAWNVQDLKNTYIQLSSSGRAVGDVMNRIALLGTLSLYIAFINMFIFLLQLLGDRR